MDRERSIRLSRTKTRQGAWGEQSSLRPRRPTFPSIFRSSGVALSAGRGHSGINRMRKPSRLGRHLRFRCDARPSAARFDSSPAMNFPHDDEARAEHFVDWILARTQQVEPHDDDGSVGTCRSCSPQRPERAENSAPARGNFPSASDRFSRRKSH